MFIAHGDEQHTSMFEASAHFLQAWYIALPLLAIGVAGFVLLVFLLTKRNLPLTYLACSALLLVVGMTTYSFAPILSVATLTIGMLIVLLLVLATLTHGQES